MTTNNIQQHGTFFEDGKYKVEFTVFERYVEYNVFTVNDGDYDDEHEFEISVKSHGCMNWTLNDCYAHICDDSDIDDMAAMFKHILNHADGIFNFRNMTFN